MRISDWSSDVCSSDLLLAGLAQRVRGFRYRSGERLARSLSSLFGGIIDAQQRLDQLGSSLFGHLACLTVRSRNGAGQLLYLNTVGQEMRLRTRSPFLEQGSRCPVHFLRFVDPAKSGVRYGLNRKLGVKENRASVRVVL